MMPKYFYKCLERDCEEIFEAVHSMKERLENCSHCSGSVERVPMNLVNISKPRDSHTPQKTGALVKKSIEEFKRDLKDEKRRLKRTEYK